jgi:uncharacterized protein
MTFKPNQKVRGWLRTFFWVALLQFFLANLSAALYAYKLTHFYNNAPDWDVAQTSNLASKSWKLFTGPSFNKNTMEELPGFPVETLRWKTQDQTEIEAWYGHQENAKGAVALFHGFACNKSLYIKEAEYFKSLGYAVLLVDFRGHGKSGGSRTSIGYWEAEEVKLAYDYLHAAGIKNIFLFGGSMGAVAVARSVSKFNLQPSGVILEIPFDGLIDHVKARGRSFGFPKNLFAYPVTAWMGAENGYNVFRHRTSIYAKQIKCPVLLQWGTNDHLVKEEETESIYTSLASSKKKLVIYDDAVHASLYLQQPEKWMQEMNAFLN